MSLESLRKLRAQTEEAIMMELAQITKEISRLEDRCQVLEREIQSDAETYRRSAEQGMTIESILEWHARIDAQHAALFQAERSIEDLNVAWNGTQSRLIEASQERKVLDRLAERNLEVQRRELRRREQYAMDEAAHRQHSVSGEQTR